MTVWIEKIRYHRWASVALGWGRNLAGEYIHFVGDAEPMARLLERLEVARGPVAATVEDWQVLAVDDFEIHQSEPDPPAHSPN